MFHLDRKRKNMNEAAAFSPCHITGFFRICDQEDDALHAGSLGAGVALSRGIETRVTAREAKKDSIRVAINGVPRKNAPVSRHVARSLLTRTSKGRRFVIEIDHRVPMPIGAGFGTSGAAALGLSLALNRLLDLRLSRIEAAQIAHAAEVECRTGLGTVIAETYGGLELRVKPGAPGIGELSRIPVSENIVIACLVFGPLSTRKLLSDTRVRIRVNEMGGRFIEELRQKPDVSSFLRLSRRFAEHVGLINERLKKVLEATDKKGFVCSMPMFGESVFTLTDRESVQDILDIFDQHSEGGKTIVSEIDFRGARELN